VRRYSTFKDFVRLTKSITNHTFKAVLTGRLSVPEAEPLCQRRDPAVHVADDVHVASDNMLRFRQRCMHM
jgi:hypothetical protein